MGYLEHYPLSVIFAASFVVMLAASEIGRRLGERASGRGQADIGTLEAAMFGLLALMIGFTFAMALSRFEARREAVLNEANAIEETALRARLLPAPYDADTLKLLREYAQLRVGVMRHVPAPDEFRAGVARSNALQDELWRQAMAGAAKADPSVSAWLALEALTDLVKSQQRRLAVIRNHMPTEVMLALYGIATLAVAFAGYAQGLRLRPSRVSLYVMSALVCSVIILIMDIETPFRGFIGISQQPIIDAIAQIPAAPR